VAAAEVDAVQQAPAIGARQDDRIAALSNLKRVLAEPK
jgi:hypothetical protein